MFQRLSHRSLALTCTELISKMLYCIVQIKFFVKKCVCFPLGIKVLKVYLLQWIVTLVHTIISCKYKNLNLKIIFH